MKPSKSLTLNDVASHFEAWRATRIGKSRIPAHLWQEAIDLHPLYTVTEITKTLRLGHSDFKKKILQTNQNLTPADFIRIDQTPTNIDIPTSHQPANDNQTTTIELEKGDGSRIRIQHKLNDQALVSIMSCYFGDICCS